MALGIRQVSVLTITLSSVSVYIGFYAWRVIFNNFAVDVFDASATDVGIIQAVREVPGLLAFGVGTLAVYFAESRIAALSIITVGLGLLVCGLSPSLVILGVGTVLMSFGFHYFEPTNSSQLLLIAKPTQLGRVQGRLRSFESMAGLGGAGLVLLLTLFVDYRITFYVIGALITAVGLYLAFALPSNRTNTDLRSFKIQRKYWLYYTLSFLRGCRRHIFTTFAVFLLVKNHDLDITAISTLMVANSVITIFTFRWLGHLNDKLGERPILVWSSLLLVFIFTGYAYVEYVEVLISLFLIDNVLFGSSISLRSYLRKIATPEDLTGCLSFGMTANHIIAVVIPILGGLAWNVFGYQVTFVAGAILVFVDMLFAMRVRVAPMVTEQ